MQELFNNHFKFDLNVSVRHKADCHKFDADMGLLILERHLIESMDGEGIRIYERSYVCRMIKFSGSGELARFNERELVSVADHDIEKATQERERNDMRNEARLVEKEVMEFFGISKENYLHEVIDGIIDTSKKFRMSGYSSGDDGLKIFVRESLFTAANRKLEAEKIEPERREWHSKSQFVVVAQ